MKIGRERNRAILNPFPYLPVDFYEHLGEREFDPSKLLIPHLINTVCVTWKSPVKMSESPQTVD